MACEEFSPVYLNKVSKIPLIWNNYYYRNYAMTLENPGKNPQWPKLIDIWNERDMIPEVMKKEVIKAINTLRGSLDLKIFQ